MDDVHVNQHELTFDINRAYALAILSNQLSFQFIKASKLRELVYEQVDQHLFDYS